MLEPDTSDRFGTAAQALVSLRAPPAVSASSASARRVDGGDEPPESASDTGDPARKRRLKPSDAEWLDATTSQWGGCMVLGGLGMVGPLVISAVGQLQSPWWMLGMSLIAPFWALVFAVGMSPKITHNHVRSHALDRKASSLGFLLGALLQALYTMRISAAAVEADAQWVLWVSMAVWSFTLLFSVVFMQNARALQRQERAEEMLGCELPLLEKDMDRRFMLHVLWYERQKHLRVVEAGRSSPWMLMWFGLMLGGMGAAQYGAGLDGMIMRGSIVLGVISLLWGQAMVVTHQLKRARLTITPEQVIGKGHGGSLIRAPRSALERLEVRASPEVREKRSAERYKVMIYATLSGSEAEREVFSIEEQSPALALTLYRLLEGLCREVMTGDASYDFSDVYRDHPGALAALSDDDVELGELYSAIMEDALAAEHEAAEERRGVSW